MRLAFLASFLITSLALALCVMMGTHALIMALGGNAPSVSYALVNGIAGTTMLFGFAITNSLGSRLHSNWMHTPMKDLWI